MTAILLQVCFKLQVQLLVLTQSSRVLAATLISTLGSHHLVLSRRLQLRGGVVSKVVSLAQLPNPPRSYSGTNATKFC
ncbi:hypothetical protein EDB85DRAFT_1303782 [Lactarius pseudohatsudake]|nr:hypothetical protein EDB85DRAFT_1303782 [Lactarius pseudohatsudake]